MRLKPPQTIILDAYAASHRIESRCRTASGHETAVVEAPEQPDRTRPLAVQGRLRLQFGAPYWEFDLWTPHRGNVCLWCLFALEPSLVSAIMASTASALRSPGER